jgi:hypothetical protein
MKPAIANSNRGIEYCPQPPTMATIEMKSDISSD